MVKVLCIVQARLTSSRLPNKVLLPIGRSGVTMVEHVYQRLSKCALVDRVVFAIPTGEVNDRLAAFLTEKRIDSFRGSEDNVLERFYQCERCYQPEVIVRATCDNPFVDWLEVENLIRHLPGYDYITSAGAPIGTSAEVFTTAAFEKAYSLSTTDREREHVTPCLYTHPETFRAGKAPYHLPLTGHYRLTIDTAADEQVAEKVYDALYEGRPIANADVYAWLDAHPEVNGLNAGVEQKEQDLISKRYGG